MPEIKRGGEVLMNFNNDPMSAPRNNHKQGLDDDDFDETGTSRNNKENSLFNGVCSMILDNFIYLGSDVVAQNYQLLSDNKITHVINTASDYSANYHEDKGLQYLSFHLKDHTRENIESCFYRSINFINEAKQQGGRIYVHCV